MNYCLQYLCFCLKPDESAVLLIYLGGNHKTELLFAGEEG
jgi:hypothetical protein